MIRKFVFFIFMFLGLYIAQSKTFSQSKAGSISSNVIKFDLDPLDEMLQFSEGFAVIHKGSAVAVINQDGKYLIPFNKYTSIDNFMYGYSKVFNSVNNNNTFVDTTGVEVKLEPHHEVSNMDKQNFLILDNGFTTTKYYYNVKTKKKYPFIPGYFYLPYHFERQDFSLHPNDLTPALIPIEEIKTHKFGYADKLGKIIIKPNFNDGHPFYNGFALVSKTNEFGQFKYFFIDSIGRSAFNKEFSLQPHNFFNGFAYVEPEDKTEFTAGYINTKGEVKIKLKGGGSDQDFRNGYLYVGTANTDEPYLIDTAGNKITIPKRANFQGIDYNFVIDWPAQNDEIIIESHSAKPGSKNGIINIKGEIIIPPIFDKISFFDPVSKLAKAYLVNSDGKAIDGYINREGVFVIIKERATKW